MYIYVFVSTLFIEQSRKIVSSYPMDIELLTAFVNSDNAYTPDKMWSLQNADYHRR